MKRAPKARAARNLGLRVTSARVVLGCAALKFVLQLSALTAYGYFRDELYYLACADRLALGYVDHPPFSIVVLAAWRALFGDSLVAIRLVPALAGAALVYVTGRIVAELGGGVRASVLACGAVLCAPAFVAMDHCYSMNALDHLLWAIGALLALQKRWIPLGVALGLGLLDKASILWFGAGLAIALLATADGRALLRTRGPWRSACIAALLFLPHVIWQVQHGWPTAEFARNAMEHKYVRLPLLSFLRETTLQINPFTLPLTVAGVVMPLRARSPARLLSIVFLTTLLIVAASKAGKPEYVNAAYPLVFASGAVALEKRSNTRGFARLVAVGGALGFAFFALTLPFALPILHEATFIAYADRLGMKPQSSEKKELAALPQFYADMHGWEELVTEAERAWNELPPDERANARIWAVTGGYGPAAAIDVLGKRRGLPHAIATHNSYWLWGYAGESADPEGAGPVVLLGGDEARLGRLFSSLERVGTVECGDCMPYENHKPVFIGRGMTRRWADVWPDVKHYE